MDVKDINKKDTDLNKTIRVTCNHCRREFEMPLGEYLLKDKLGEKIFCSNECRRKYDNNGSYKYNALQRIKVYNDNHSDTINIVQSVASASTMISSLAGEIKEYVVSKFPKGYFKHIYIDTSETVTQQNINANYNKTANKIPYPSMTITPEISLDDPIGIEKTIHYSSPNLYLRRDVNRTYKKIMVDPDEKFGIYYTNDFITTNFNFKIATNSFIQNADLAFYLKSKFQKDFFQYWNGRHVQTEIPKTFIKIISNMKGWNINNSEEMDQLRLYLIGTTMSQQAIQKKINLATGKQCFFLNDRSNFLVMFSDLDCPPSVIRDSQIEGEYIITFRIQVSTWIPNAFILSMNKEKLTKAVSLEELREFDNTNLYDAETGLLSLPIGGRNMPGKKDTIEFRDNAGETQIGIRVFDDVFMPKFDKPFELLKYMKEDLQAIHRYCIIKNIDISSLIHIDVYDKDEKLGPDRYEFDYDLFTLQLSEGIESDIEIVIYANRVLYESIKKAMIEDKYFFSDNILTKIMVKIGTDDKLRLLVKAFKNTNERSTTDVDKSIRVYTPYGIGYASLLPDDDSEDAYKICVGFDNDGYPIVSKFETVTEEN